jgi:hypothetical protein
VLSEAEVSLTCTAYPIGELLSQRRYLMKTNNHTSLFVKTRLQYFIF